MPSTEDVSALVARALDGDVRAFEALVADHLPRVRRFARAFAASEADADDLAQDALVRAYRSLHLFRARSSFSSWLYAIVRNLFLDGARSRAGQVRAAEVALEHAGDGDGEPQVAPDVLLETEEQRRSVWRAIREVPAEFRTALVLFDIEGHSYEEIAAVEAVPVGTVKSRLSRGRAHLRRVLARAAGRIARESPAEAHPGTSGASPTSHERRSGS